MLQYISGYFKRLNFKRHETESFVFYLHYRVTFMLLMTCCIAVTSNLFAGSPIVCTEALDVTESVMASYCWSHSTYSIRSAYDKKVGRDVPYPGIAASEDETTYVYRDYYQWVYLVLFFQGIFFYVPHCLWKGLENGKMEQIWKNICDPPALKPNMENHLIKQDPTFCKDEKMMASATFLSSRQGLYNMYSFWYWFCEVLSLLNIVFQVWFLNLFFRGEFFSMGERTLEYFLSDTAFDSSLVSIFPRVAKCHFHKFGPSGNVDTVDVLCILPINALTEKIYLFMWFWFAILFCLTSLGLLVDALTLLVPQIRGMRLSFGLNPVRFSVFQDTDSAAFNVGEICGFADWFVLQTLKKKMDVLDYKQLMLCLHDEISVTAKRKKTLSAILSGATAV